MSLHALMAKHICMHLFSTWPGRLAELSVITAVMVFYGMQAACLDWKGLVSNTANPELHSIFDGMNQVVCEPFSFTKVPMGCAIHELESCIDVCTDQHTG